MYNYFIRDTLACQEFKSKFLEQIYARLLLWTKINFKWAILKVYSVSFSVVCLKVVFVSYKGYNLSQWFMVGHMSLETLAK